MKILFVALYLMNIAGGQPELVVQFESDPETAMLRCQAALKGYKSNGGNIVQLVCVPVYKNAP